MNNYLVVVTCASTYSQLHHCQGCHKVMTTLSPHCNNCEIRWSQLVAIFGDRLSGDGLSEVDYIYYWDGDVFTKADYSETCLFQTPLGPNTTVLNSEVSLF